MKSFLLIFWLLIIFPFISKADTIYVPGDYLTIQGAIDAAFNGDILLVSPGTYYENIDMRGKAIFLKSLEGPDRTCIDGMQSGSVITLQTDEGPDTCIMGFTISNGRGTYVQNGFIKEFMGGYIGGGVFCNKTSPTLSNNIIMNNRAGYGGGIYCYLYKTHPTIIDCSILLNKANCGGGIFSHSTDVRISNCLIKENLAEVFGGGIRIFLSGKPIIKGNIIDSNIGVQMGGGIECSNSPTPIIKNNIITHNISQSGGGIFISRGHVYNNVIMFNEAKDESMTSGSGGGITVSNGSLTDTIIEYNKISNNKAIFSGGGISSYGALYRYNKIFNNEVVGGGQLVTRGGGIIINSFSSKTIITNSIISNNYSRDHGGGIGIGKDVEVDLINCTLSQNKSRLGMGISIFYVDYILYVYNSILFDSSTSEIYYSDNAPVIEYSNVKGGWPGIGNINNNPCFVEAAENDCHILYHSPCRDVGSNAYINGDYDYENDPRISNTIVDMGADEFYEHLYFSGDNYSGSCLYTNFIGYPSNDPVYLILGLQALKDPIPTIYGSFYLMPPLIELGPFGPMKLNGKISYRTVIPYNLPGSYTVSTQAIINYKLTNYVNLQILENK